MSPSSDYTVVADALIYIDTHFREQPSLDEVAAHVGLSPFHFQRVFTRWAGVSPKRFLQYLTLEEAKKRLRRSEPVLAAAFGSGLSGPARLHDLFITVESMTPGSYKAGGDGLTLRYGVHPSPFGDCLLARTERGLCHLAFIDRSLRDAMEDLRKEWPAANLLDSPGETAEMAASIFRWREASQRSSALSVVLKGTNFQLKVWTALLRIPPGALSTYGRLAATLDRPGAARAVGRAVATNSIAYLIPCHRVIRSMGGFGDYRWGAIRKRAMLGLEAAEAEP